MFYEFPKTVSASICRTPGPSKKNRATEVKMLQSRVTSHILRKKSPRIFIASNFPRWLTPGKKRWLGFSPFQTGPTKNDAQNRTEVTKTDPLWWEAAPELPSMIPQTLSPWLKNALTFDPLAIATFFLEIPTATVIRTSNKLRRGVKMEDGISFGMMDS